MFIQKKIIYRWIYEFISLRFYTFANQLDNYILNNQLINDWYEIIFLKFKFYFILGIIILLHKIKKKDMNRRVGIIYVERTAEIHTVEANGGYSREATQAKPPLKN